MKGLNLARKTRGLTQGQLAELIGTTQQTIGRWETGKAEPSHAALRDLAICLHTTVDKLLGREPVLEHQTTDPLAWISGDKSGYWGNIGIRLPKSDFSTWYPVTTSAMDQIHGALQEAERDDWISFQTLNNKMVVCRPSQLPSFMFLDEADDQVDGDWNVGPADVEGWPEEIYECLEHLMWDELGASFDEGEFSDKLIAAAKELIHENELDADKLMAMCVQTRVIGTDGKARPLHVSKARLADVMFYFDLGMESFDSIMLHLDDNDGDRELFLSLEQIALLEFPLLALKKGMKKMAEEDGDDGFDDDGDPSEAVGTRRSRRQRKQKEK